MKLKLFGILFSLLLTSVSEAKRIGIYAGTFDPFQTGHLHLVQDAVTQLALDELYILINPPNHFKPNASPFQIRLKMTKLAIEGLEKVKVMTPEMAEVFHKHSYEGFMEAYSSFHASDSIFSISGNDILQSIEKGEYRPIRLPNVTLAVAVRKEFGNEVPSINGVNIVMINS